MSGERVLITPYFLRPGDDTDRRLREAGLETVFNPWHGGRTEEEMIDILRGIDAVIAHYDPFTARVFDSADRLRVVARVGVGYDAIDVAAAEARGVVVTINPGVNHRPVAEYAFGLVLALSRRLLENLSVVSQGGWTCHQGWSLLDRTLGIVGLGRIGKEVAKRARVFEMRVLAYDLIRDDAFAEQHQVEYVSLERLLRESDYVTLHLPLDATTRHLINAERLALMKPTAYLVNTDRGAIVDTEALCDALREKRIAGAALDTYEREPLDADSPLRKLENVYLSVHAAGATWDNRRRVGLAAAENVIRVLRGEPPLNALAGPHAHRS